MGDSANPQAHRVHGQRGGGGGRGVRQAKLDLFDEGHELVVIAELPGAREEEIMVEISGSRLYIGTPLVSLRPFWGETELPCPVMESCRYYRNSTLKLHFAKEHTPYLAMMSNPFGQPDPDPAPEEHALRR